MGGVMRRAWVVVLALSAAGFATTAACVGDDPGASSSGGPDDAGSSGDTNTGSDTGGGNNDAGIDATDGAVPRCNPQGTFVETDVTELNSPLANGGARLSHDELTVYWHRAESDAALPVIGLWTAKRATRDGVFGSLQPVVGLNRASDQSDLFPALLPNGDLIFHSDRGPSFPRDLYVSKRMNGTFTDPTPFAPLANANYGERIPYPSNDGKEIYLTTDNFNDSGIRIARSQEVAAGSYSLPTLVDLGGSTAELSPVLSADFKTLYFARGAQMYYAKRADRDSAWGPASPLTELNVADSSSQPTWISDDDCVLWFFSNRPANDPVSRIFVAVRSK